MKDKRSIIDIEIGVVADEVGLTRFRFAMSDKLRRKRLAGRGGWNKPPYENGVIQGGCTVAQLRSMLFSHLEKGDMVDIANFAMMIWNREHPTNEVDEDGKYK